MIIVVTVAKVMFLVFCSDDRNSNGNVTKQRAICEKLVGIGSVMENYVGCNP